jgi:acyl-CoA synthetase (AMP-forming)/AMP-acid ligase II
VGRPVFRVAVEVVDASDRPLPAGVIGRVRFRGPGVATTFLAEDGRPQSMGSDGAFYPGDLALIDAAGYVTLQGREKDLIIRGGVNVYPAEVERVLGGHPAVRDAAVVGWPSPALGEEVAAFVAADPGTDGAALRDWCRERLAPYKVPRAVFVVPELPKTGAGKVSKAELAAGLPPLPPD